MTKTVQQSPWFLAGDGEMAARMRAFDWSATVLGAPDTWPIELKVATSICLQSSAPMAIYWGPTFKLLYNDAWAPIPGERHPDALGRPGAQVWADIWNVVGPQLQGVLDSGHGFAVQRQRLDMVHHGLPRESWWNYSFTPIRGEDGRVLGILNEGLEITDKVQLEKRQTFLLSLSDSLRGLSDPREVIQTAQRLLGAELGANRVGYGEVDPTERWFTTTDNWTDGVPSRHGTHDLAGFGPTVHADLKAGHPLVVENVATDPRLAGEPEIQAAFAAIDTAAALTASLVKGGRMVAALYVHSKTPRSWSESDQAIVRDVAERTWAEVVRARAEGDAHASEARYRRIFEQSSDLVVTTTLDRVITDANPAAAAALGFSVDELLGRTTTEFLFPEDQPVSAEMLNQKLIASGGTTRYDVRVKSASGEPLHLEINSGLTFDERGDPVGVHLVARDITERKRWESQQRLLVGELNHRVKNTLAIVQSLSHQTFRPGTPPEESIKAFDGRLQALAAAHNLLTRSNWEAALIGDVVHDALAPFCESGHCTADGPAVKVNPQTAVSLALAVHELATNAVKYGAFSVPVGRVSVSWEEEKGKFAFEWRESGGPKVKAPTRSGFGTRMIQRALSAELGGPVVLQYHPSGVVCRIEVPLPEDEPLAAE